MCARVLQGSLFPAHTLALAWVVQNKMFSEFYLGKKKEYAEWNQASCNLSSKLYQYFLHFYHPFKIKITICDEYFTIFFSYALNKISATRRKSE